MCGGKKKQTVAPAAKIAPPPQIVQEMTRAANAGPGGFTPAMKTNTGFGLPANQVMPRSNMTRFPTPVLMTPKPAPTPAPAINNPQLTTLLGG